MISLDNIEVEELVRKLLEVAPHVKIAHHIPGRIRLKMSLSGLDTLMETDIEGIITAIPGVLNTRINAFAMSAVIEYDHEQLPYELWVTLGEVGTDHEKATEVAKRLTTLLGL